MTQPDQSKSARWMDETLRGIRKDPQRAAEYIIGVEAERDAERAKNRRLLDWLYYIEQTTNDDNVLAAIELANRGLAAEFEATLAFDDQEARP
jgi:DNA polymerase elongation subunit (family B)